MTRSDPVLANRHADELRGKLASLDDTRPAHIHIVVANDAAATRCGQLLALHVANLLGRLERVIISIRVTIEGNERTLLPDVDPRCRSGGIPLDEAILQNACLANVSRRAPVDSPVDLVLGVGRTETSCDLYGAASDWAAYIGRVGVACSLSASAAIGPFLAAAFLSADVFRRLRAKAPELSQTVPFVFDAWSWSVRPVSDDMSSADIGRQFALIDHTAIKTWGLRLRDFTLVGVGAVGCATLLALWASGVSLRATIVDGDRVAHTNLNRYALFSLNDRGQLKANRAATLLGRPPSPQSADSTPGEFHLEPFDGWWSDYQRSRGARLDTLLVSCVDTNTARHQLQDALPRVILGASTHGLRIEIARYDLSKYESRCLKCHNTPEGSESDLLLQRRLLAMHGEELIQEATARNVSPQQLSEYVADLRAGGNGCAILGGEALERLRRKEGEGSFAVSFVSSLGGTLLAAQIVRESIDTPLLEAPRDRSILQLWRPHVASNTLYPTARDRLCWCSGVREVYRETWDTSHA